MNVKSHPLYQVLLLPRKEVAARHQTLAEASAWVRTYNETLDSPEARAVIAEEPAHAPPVRRRAA